MNDQANPDAEPRCGYVAVVCITLGRENLIGGIRSDDNGCRFARSERAHKDGVVFAIVIVGDAEFLSVRLVSPAINQVCSAHLVEADDRVALQAMKFVEHGGVRIRSARHHGDAAERAVAGRGLRGFHGRKMAVMRLIRQLRICP